MSLPRQLVRVTWEVAIHPDRPWDRHEQSRNFTSRENAGAQVLQIRLWEPAYAQLLGVWECAGTNGLGHLLWRPLNPDVLPIPDGAVARAQALRQHSPMYEAMMIRGGTDEPDYDPDPFAD